MNCVSKFADELRIFFKKIIKKGHPQDFINVVTEAMKYGIENDILAHMNLFAEFCIIYDRLDMMTMLIDKYHFDPCQDDSKIIEYCAGRGSNQMMQLLDNYKVNYEN